MIADAIRKDTPGIQLNFSQTSIFTLANLAADPAQINGMLHDFGIRGNELFEEEQRVSY